MKNVTVDMILLGQIIHDDQTVLKDLGYNLSKNRVARINFIVDKLIFHQFGNYVLQKIITIIKSDQLRVIILQRINQLSGDLQRTKHGQKVLQKLQKTYPHVFNSFASGSNMNNACTTAANYMGYANNSSNDNQTAHNSNQKL